MVYSVQNFPRISKQFRVDAAGATWLISGIVQICPVPWSASLIYLVKIWYLAKDGSERALKGSSHQIFASKIAGSKGAE
jgi:hypothetical protein